MTQMMNMYDKNREAIGSRCFAASAPSPPVSDIPDTADPQFDRIENSSNADNPNGPTEPHSMLDDLKSPFLADAQCLDLPEPCVDENGDNEGKGLWAESFYGDETGLKDDFDDDNERKFDVHEIEESDSDGHNIKKPLG